MQEFNWSLLKYPPIDDTKLKRDKEFGELFLSPSFAAFLSFDWIAPYVTFSSSRNLLQNATEMRSGSGETSSSEGPSSNGEVTCLELTRSTAFCESVHQGPREQMNAITAFIDASNVYG